MTEQRTDDESKVLYRAEMPPGFEDGPAPTMSPLAYWLLSVLLIRAPRTVLDDPFWQQQVDDLVERTNDGLDEHRWDVTRTWLAATFTDVSDVLPTDLAAVVRNAAASGTAEAVERARLYMQDSDAYAGEAAREDRDGTVTVVTTAMWNWVMFLIDCTRPFDQREPGLFRTVAAAAEQLAPLRPATTAQRGVQALLASLIDPTGDPTRSADRHVY
ncbi:hypothetical protein ACWGJ9_08225 [Curtobacterium citreum]